MRKIARAMSVLVAAAVLPGCGAAPETPKDVKASGFKTRVLEHVRVLEQECEADAVNFDTVMSVIQSLERLREHMQREGKGSVEQRDRIFDFTGALREAASTGGRSMPPADWQPTEENPEPPPPVNHKIVSAPFGRLLSQLRSFLESID